MAMPMHEFFYGGWEPAYSSPASSGYENLYSSESTQAWPSVYGTRRTSIPTFELMVPMCCATCEEQIQEALLDLEGVCDVVTDPYNQRVMVTGYEHPKRALKQARRVNKNATLWSEVASTPSYRVEEVHRHQYVDSEKTSYHRRYNQSGGDTRISNRTFVQESPVPIRATSASRISEGSSYSASYCPSYRDSSSVQFVVPNPDANVERVEFN